ncbi:MAG: hypothetical protein OEZ31_03090 [Nitrospirota bacterium]|nr:hypothetical protein [Nitrospirota bacterium]
MRNDNESLRGGHIESSIGYKIALAYDLQSRYGQSLLHDEKIKTLLVQLDKNIGATWKEMEFIGVVKECTDCALNGGGSCCGAGMEKNYDSILLFINLMLGKILPSEYYDPHSCYFLSGQGCVLRARQVICVNYLCQRISKNIQQDKLIRLQKIAGEELKTLFMLEEYIKKEIRLTQKIYRS